MSDESRNDLVFLGGLWLADDRNGNKYMSGSLGVAGRVLVFRNGSKKTDSDPDFLLYVSGRERKASEPDMDDIPF